MDIPVNTTEPLPDGPHVIVVGAGIAGLTTAFLLQRAGCRVTVLERSGPERVGGRMSTIEHDGFLVDTAASLLSRRYRGMLELAAAAGVADSVLPSSDLVGLLRDRRVHRVRIGSLPRMAAGMLRFAPARADLPKLMADHLRIRRTLDWADLSAAARYDGETVSEYAVRRGMRPSTVEYLLDPLCMLASLQDAERTSSIAPFMLLHSLMGGGGFFTFAEGVGFLPRTLARRLAVEFHATVRSVEERGDEVRVTWSRPDGGDRTWTADACVIAVPPPQMLGIHPQLGAEHREFFEGVEYAGSAHIAFGLDRPTAEKAVMVNVPRGEHPALVGFLMPHNTVPGRVPAGRGLVMAHFRGSWSDDNSRLDDAALTDHALAAARDLGLVPELHTHTTTTHVLRSRQCVVFRRPGDYRACARLAGTLPNDSRIRLAGGDYFTQSSTHHSLTSAVRAARRTVESLRLPATGPAPRRRRTPSP